MSTNISEIMFELEQAGRAGRPSLTRERVAEIVLALLVAGQQSVVAARSEAVLSRVVASGVDASEVVTALRAVRSGESAG